MHAQKNEVANTNSKHYKMKKITSVLLLATMMMFFNSLMAQINNGVLPKSSEAGLSSIIVPQYNVATPDLARIQAREKKSIQDGTPLKVAVVVPLNLNMNNSGLWESTDDGCNVWRLRISNENAKGCDILFNRFDLPEGAQFFCYNEDMTLIYGPYTRESNLSGEGFTSGIFAKGDVILEYVSPRQFNNAGTANIEIAGYTYFFNKEGLPQLGVTSDGETGYGASQSCMINVNCSEGDNWRVQQRGVARILAYGVEDGDVVAGWCSGTLINNTMGDGTPYFLTANHCADGATATYLNYTEFYFNYECPYCTCYSEPSYSHFTGAEKVSYSAITGGSDFLLLKMRNASLNSLKQAGAVFNGWNKSTSASNSGVCIHHPAADVKKISTYSQQLTSGTFNDGATNAYWVVPWATTAHGHSVTEGGSSGSPLFNQNGLVVGTLTGGSSTCIYEAREFYGKISYHWTSAGTASSKQLKPWLDPVPMSASTCDYLDLTSSFYVIPAAHVFDVAGGSFNYQLTSNDSWSVSYVGDHSWFTLNLESGISSYPVTVTCDPNVGEDARKCTVKFTKSDGTIFKVTVKQNGTATGIADVTNDKSITVFPNPASDQVRIESAEKVIKNVEIVDMLGKVVYNYTNNGESYITLPVSQLENAMYIIRIYTDKNEIIYKKFSKN